MEIILAIVLFLFLVAAIVLIVSVNRKVKAEDQPVPEQQADPDPSCCGAHEICDFDLVKANPEIIEYFDDEDLDRLANTHPDQYSEKDIDELREVLYTLKTHEIRNWLLSLDRRRIHLPDFLKDEARDLQLGNG
jgi:hypothetical protein